MKSESYTSLRTRIAGRLKSSTREPEFMDDLSGVVSCRWSKLEYHSTAELVQLDEAWLNDCSVTLLLY